MSDLMFQQLSTVQNSTMQKPVTMASAATLAPQTKLTFVTGTVQVATVTAPVTGYHELTFIFTNAAPGALLTTGNIQAAYTPITNQAFTLVYDPSTAKYWRPAVT